jgi:hypothetical protein
MLLPASARAIIQTISQPYMIGSTLKTVPLWKIKEKLAYKITTHPLSTSTIHATPQQPTACSLKGRQSAAFQYLLSRKHHL